MECKVFFLATMLACVMVSKAQEVSLATLDNRLSQLENIVSQCKCADDVVAFSVNMAGEASEVAVQHHVIAFPHIVTNAGNGYSAVTDGFTAPVRGVYAFFVHLDVSADYTSAQITRNGVQVRVLYGAQNFSLVDTNTSGHVYQRGPLPVTPAKNQVPAIGHSDGDSRFLSAFVVMNLNAGDIIDVRHANNLGTIDGGGESTFAGFRLGDIPRN